MQQTMVKILWCARIVINTARFGNWKSTWTPQFPKLAVLITIWAHHSIFTNACCIANTVYWKVQMFFCFRNDICNATGVGETTVMCPNCDQYCPFWKLRSSCGLSELTYIIDNDGTVFFAIFMSFWGMYFSHFFIHSFIFILWLEM